MACGFVKLTITTAILIMLGIASHLASMLTRYWFTFNGDMNAGLFEVCIKDFECESYFDTDHIDLSDELESIRTVASAGFLGSFVALLLNLIACSRCCHRKNFYYVISFLLILSGLTTIGSFGYFMKVKSEDGHLLTFRDGADASLKIKDIGVTSAYDVGYSAYLVCISGVLYLITSLVILCAMCCCTMNETETNSHPSAPSARPYTIPAQHNQPGLYTIPMSHQGSQPFSHQHNQNPGPQRNDASRALRNVVRDEAKDFVKDNVAEFAMDVMDGTAVEDLEGNIESAGGMISDLFSCCS